MTELITKNEQTTTDFDFEADKKSFTPLMLAAAHGNLQTIKDLIASGASLEEESLFKSTAILFAAQNGHLECVNYLAEKGANLYHQNLAGFNIFVYAARNETNSLLNWIILEKKFSPTARDVNTALLYARFFDNFPQFFSIYTNYQELVGNDKEFEDIIKDTKPYIKFSFTPNFYINYCKEILLLRANLLESLETNVAESIVDLMMDSLLNNTSLKQLTYRDHHHTSKIAKNLEIFLSRSAFLEELNFFPKSASDVIYQSITALIANENSKLKKLNLYNCKLDSLTVNALAKFIENNNTLEELNLNHCELGPELTSIILNAFNKNPKKIRKLDLTYNQIGPIGAQTLSKLLVNEGCSLQALTLNANHNLNKEGMIAITNALKLNKTVTQLNLASIYPNDNEAVLDLASMIEVNKQLVQLDIHGNQFSDSQGAMIANAIKSNSSLEIINMSGVSGDGLFSKETAKALGSALQVNKTLKNLNLMMNTNLGKEIAHLALGLKENKSLEKLDLSYTYVNDQTFIALLDSLNKNKTLQSLNLNICDISNDGMKRLALATENNENAINTLYLWHNKIDEENYINFFNKLKTNTTLTTLTLGYNNYYTRVSAKAAQSLLEALKNDNRTLKNIYGYSSKGDIEEIDSLLLRNSQNSLVIESSLSTKNSEIDINTNILKPTESIHTAFAHHLDNTPLEFLFNFFNKTIIKNAKLEKNILEIEFNSKIICDMDHFIKVLTTFKEEHQFAYALNFSNCSLRIDDTKKLISTILSSKIDIVKLDLSDNLINKDIQILIAELIKSTSIQELNLSNKPTPRSFVLKSAIEQSKTLQVIDLKGHNYNQDELKVINLTLKSNILQNQLNETKLGLSVSEDSNKKLKSENQELQKKVKNLEAVITELDKTHEETCNEIESLKAKLAIAIPQKEDNSAQAVKIQAHVRGFFARREYKKLNEVKLTVKKHIDDFTKNMQEAMNNGDFELVSTISQALKPINDYFKKGRFEAALMLIQEKEASKSLEMKKS